MIATSLRATSNIDGTNVKLAMVNMGLLLMEPVTRLSLSGKGAYSYTTKIFLLLDHSS